MRLGPQKEVGEDERRQRMPRAEYGHERLEGLGIEAPRDALGQERGPFSVGSLMDGRSWASSFGGRHDIIFNDPERLLGRHGKC